jgi:hypothetical protein
MPTTPRTPPNGWRKAARWQQRGGCGGGGSATAQRWRQHGGVSGGGGSAKRGGDAQRNSGSAVAAARRLWRWRQRDVGGSSTVRECANARAFEHH